MKTISPWISAKALFKNLEDYVQRCCYDEEIWFEYSDEEKEGVGVLVVEGIFYPNYEGRKYNGTFTLDVWRVYVIDWETNEDIPVNDDYIERLKRYCK